MGDDGGSGLVVVCIRWLNFGLKMWVDLLDGGMPFVVVMMGLGLEVADRPRQRDPEHQRERKCGPVVVMEL